MNSSWVGCYHCGPDLVPSLDDCCDGEVAVYSMRIVPMEDTMVVKISVEKVVESLLNGPVYYEYLELLNKDKLVLRGVERLLESKVKNEETTVSRYQNALAFIAQRANYRNFPFVPEEDYPE